ncbi:MAG: hypothetical protein JST26_15060 [Bacteroidetes bacterium]|nr:hypothetical protein [Bacteroidota bacterium]
MRIALSLVLLTDLVIRSLSIKAHYSDEGVLPISILKQYNWNPYYFSLHAISGSVWFEAFLFILNALCVLCLLIGYRTRLFTFICWIFLVSLQNRNPFILQGGDELLRLAIFWGMFLPWGERYAVQTPTKRDNDYFSFANLGYIILVASVYFFSALLKASPEWHEEGSAIYYALSLDQIRMPLGSILYRHPDLMRFMTHFVYWLEVVAPLLMILPLKPKYSRWIGALGIFCLHLGIVSTLYVGLFYIIGISTLVGMIPPHLADKIEQKFFPGAAEKRALIPDEKTNRWLSFIRLNISIYAILLIAYCLMLNLGQVKKFRYELRYELLGISNILRLEQSWGMFAPAVLKDDGWYIYAGFTDDRKLIDIGNDKDSIDYTKPERVVAAYESDRWRKFGENYTFNNNNHMRPYFCQYLIREWNRKHPAKHITEANVYYMQETTLPDYKTKPIQKITVCNCRENTETHE